MKHEVISQPLTNNVLRLMFECKTFDEKDCEKETNKFETFVKLNRFKNYSVGKKDQLIQTISI